MHDSTQLPVASIRRAVGRIRINDPEEKVTARFPAGTLARMKAVLQPKEPQAEFIRQAVLSELRRREPHPQEHK